MTVFILKLKGDLNKMKTELTKLNQRKERLEKMKSNLLNEISIRETQIDMINHTLEEITQQLNLEYTKDFENKYKNLSGIKFFDVWLSQDEQDHKGNQKKKRTYNYNRAVQQFTQSGEYIRTYDNLTEASERTGIGYKAIQAAATGKVNTAGGFVFKYE